MVQMVCRDALPDASRCSQALHVIFPAVGRKEHLGGDADSVFLAWLLVLLWSCCFCFDVGCSSSDFTSDSSTCVALTS